MRAASAISAVATPRSAARGVRHDHQLRSQQGRRGGHAAQSRHAAQVALERERGVVESLRVVAGQHQLQQFARLGADVADPRAGQVGQARADVALEFLLRAGPVVGHAPVEHQGRLARFADAGLGRVADVDRAADRGVHMLEFGDAGQLGARQFGQRDRVLQPRAGRQLQAEVAAAQVGDRDEGGRDEGHDRQRAEEQDEGDPQGQRAMAQGRVDPTQVPGHQAGFAVLLRMRLQLVGRHHRRQQARHQQREHHRGGRRPAELLEELAGDAGHEGDRHEHRRQRQRRGDHRRADLVGGVAGRVQRRLAHAQVAHDVLDLDDGVVDQDADHHRQGEQGDDVQ
jgi:hypothetical protein